MQICLTTLNIQINDFLLQICQIKIVQKCKILSLGNLRHAHVITKHKKLFTGTP